MEKIFETMFEKARGYCRDKTDLVHLSTALAMAEKLIHLEGGNERIIIPAIILHDTGWHNFSEDEERKTRGVCCLKLEDAILNHRHEVESSLIAQNVLAEVNYPEEDKDRIIEIITGHDTRTKAISKEDRIVKDADKLSKHTPECFSLFCSKLKVNEEEFFVFLNSNLERWFFTDRAKLLAREYLLKRKLGTPEAEFPEGLLKNLYEILISLEGEVAKKLKVNLEGLAINVVCEKVSDVVRMIKIYLAGQRQENIDVSDLQKDEEFQAIATQRVGEGGYIGIIERQTGKIIFHPDKRLINLSPEELKKQYRPPDFLHGFWEWHKRARDGEEFYSYYQGMNTKQEIIDKFHYCIPLDIKNVKWAVTAVADCKDFFKPMDILSQEIIQGVRGTSFQIGELANLANRQAKEIQEEKERLNVTLRSIGDGVIVADTQGRVVLLNKVAEQLTGWKEEEAMNKPEAEVFHIINEYTRRRCENPVQKVLESGLIVGLANHTILMARDGSERVIADSGAPIYGKDGDVIGVVLVFRDITEKRHSEERLRQAERLAAAVQIASEAAHEVKNPLAVIKVGLYYLERILPKEEEAQKILSRMDKATQRAVTYIDDLLNFSRPPELKISKININEMIKQALDELPAEIFSNIEVQQELFRDLPDILVDFDRLKQVVTNLVKNAAEAIGQGSGVRGQGSERIEIKSEKEGDFIKISVSDTGKGIIEEDRKRIFDPFFTTKGKGTGLGLAICQRIIEAHKGEIEVKSEVGKGTTFVVKLPIK